jgi:hypothetical protein
MPYEIPSWINSPPNYGKSFAMGTEAGSGVARNMIAGYVARNQAARAAEESAREDALQPLKKQLMQNKVTDSALDIQTSLYKQQDYLEQKRGMAQLAQVSAEISAEKKWDDEASLNRIQELGVAYPSLPRTKEYWDTIALHKTSSGLSRNLLETQRRAKAAEDKNELQKTELDDLRNFRKDTIALGHKKVETEKTIADNRNTTTLDVTDRKTKSAERIANWNNASHEIISELEGKKSRFDPNERAMLTATQEQIKSNGKNTLLDPDEVKRRNKQNLDQLEADLESYKGRKNKAALGKRGTGDGTVQMPVRGRIGIFDEKTHNFIDYAD